jgi:hypothetical protein
MVRAVVEPRQYGLGARSRLAALYSHSDCGDHVPKDVLLQVVRAVATLMTAHQACWATHVQVCRRDSAGEYVYPQDEVALRS